MKNHPIIKFLTSLRLTVVTLCLSVVVVFLGTVAQEAMGLKLALDYFFKQFFIDSVSMQAALDKCRQMFFEARPDPIPQEKLIEGGWPCFPGGYLLGSILLVNLTAAYYTRFVFSWKKAGIIMTHFGIIMLLVGQVLTDQLAIESYVAMNAGDRRNYSISHDYNELVVVTELEGGTNKVVSIPEKLLSKKPLIKHPELNGVTIRTTRYWRNAHLVNELPEVITHHLEEFKQGSKAFHRTQRAAKLFRSELARQGIPNEKKAWLEYISTSYAAADTTAEHKTFLNGLRGFLKKVHSFSRDRGKDAQAALWIIQHDVDFSMDSRNWPVAELKIVQPKTKDEDRKEEYRIVSQQLKDQDLSLGSKNDEEITAKFALRGKRYYHPYSLTLQDLKWEWYPGTQTPRNF